MMEPVDALLERAAAALAGLPPAFPPPREPGGAEAPPPLSELSAKRAADVADVGFADMEDLVHVYQMLCAGGRGGHGAGRRHVDDDAPPLPPLPSPPPTTARWWPNGSPEALAAPGWARAARRSLLWALLAGAGRSEAEPEAEAEARARLAEAEAGLRDACCLELHACADAFVECWLPPGQRKKRGMGRAAVVRALASPAAWDDGGVHDATLLHAARHLGLALARLGGAPGVPLALMPRDAPPTAPALTLELGAGGAWEARAWPSVAALQEAWGARAGVPESSSRARLHGPPRDRAL